MLSIVVILLNRKNITAKELAERFEVSLRTIYRDIDAINEAGIPVVSVQGSGGGYQIMDNYKLHHQYLTIEDTKAIMTALKGVHSTLRDNELKSAMEKIRSLVPKEKTAELDLKMEQLVIDYLPWGYSDRQQVQIQDINRAIFSSKLLKFQYLNLKGEVSERLVEPMTLMFKGYSWYLFGYCRMRKDGRMFKLSRIKKIQMTNQLFNRREISFRDFTKPDENQGPKVDLELLFSPRARLRVEEFFFPHQIKYRETGEMEVNVSFPEDDWIQSMLLSFGDKVKVLKPESIRLKIKEIAKNITAQY